jgi:hypothetical protein
MHCVAGRSKANNMPLLAGIKDLPDKPNVLSLGVVAYSSSTKHLSRLTGFKFLQYALCTLWFDGISRATMAKSTRHTAKKAVM